MSTSSQASVQVYNGRTAQTALSNDPLGLVEWVGASGRQYQHLVYGLIECPLAPKANYVLARRDNDGRVLVLKVGRASHDAPTLNRAQLRHEAALLGANEVHLHVQARTEAERILIEFDLAAAASVSCEPAVSVTRH